MNISEKQQLIDFYINSKILSRETKDLLLNNLLNK